MELLDELHLEKLHLHNLLLFDLAHAALVFQLTVDVSLDRGDSSLSILFNLKLCKPLLLVDKLILHFVVLLGFHFDLVSALFKLLLNGFRLFRLLSFRQEYRLLDLSLLILALLLKNVVALTTHLLRLNVHLQINDFL